MNTLFKACDELTAWLNDFDWQNESFGNKMIVWWGRNVKLVYSNRVIIHEKNNNYPKKKLASKSSLHPVNFELEIMRNIKESQASANWANPSGYLDLNFISWMQFYSF